MEALQFQIADVSVMCFLSENNHRVLRSGSLLKDKELRSCSSVDTVFSRL